MKFLVKKKNERTTTIQFNKLEDITSEEKM